MAKSLRQQIQDLQAGNEELRGIIDDYEEKFDVIELEYLRAFSRLAHNAKWIDENLASKLESPRVKQRPTMPFTPEEMVDILRASEDYARKYRGAKYRVPGNVWRIRAFVLLLRHSGLRIGDAVALERRRIAGGKLFLYTAKTETPVYCPLPVFVLTAPDVRRSWTAPAHASRPVGYEEAG